MAANPTLRPPEWPDWRARYRAMVAPNDPTDATINYADGATDWHYDLAAAGASSGTEPAWVPAPDYAGNVPLEWPVVPPLADAGDGAAARRDAAAVVATALVQTAGIGSAERAGPERMRDEGRQAQFEHFVSRDAPDERIGAAEHRQFAEDLPAASAGRDRFGARDGFSDGPGRPTDDGDGDEAAPYSEIHR